MNKKDIVIESGLFRLTVDPHCKAKSLIIKALGVECLCHSERLPLFSVTQERPYNNEIKLSHPNGVSGSPGDRVELSTAEVIVERGGNTSTGPHAELGFEGVLGHGVEPGRQCGIGEVHGAVFLDLPVLILHAQQEEAGTFLGVEVVYPAQGKLTNSTWAGRPVGLSGSVSWGSRLSPSSITGRGVSM